MAARLRLLAALLLVPGPAAATYSVVATDSATRQVGGAGTSCIGNLSVTIIYGSAPGVGAVHAQALVNTDGRDEAVRLLLMGRAPADVIAAITAPGFDGQASRRQYGVVDLEGRAAGWTGSQNGSFAGDRQGTAGALTYSVQGNILTGVAVIDQAEAAFVSGGGCDLPERLMLALEAGAQGGEGDSRCTPSGFPSDSGFLRVQDELGNDVVSLDVTGTPNPLPELRRQLDGWRATHPCPAAMPDGGPDGSDGGAAGTGGGGGCGCGAAGAGAPRGLAGALLLLGTFGGLGLLRRLRA